MEAHLAHNQEYAGSSPVSATQWLKGKRNLKERSWYSLKSLQVMDDQMEIGQVKTITSNGGRTVDYCELLFSSSTKAQFAPSEDKTTRTFAVSENNLSLPQLQCNINKEVLRDLIINLKNIYNELESEENK